MIRSFDLATITSHNYFTGPVFMWSQCGIYDDSM